MRVLGALIVASATLAACGPKGTTCGTGTFRDGGTCYEDPSFALTNPQDLGDKAYWNCLTTPIGEFAIQLSDGTGQYRVLDPTPGAVQQFTWAQGSTPDSIQITSNTPAGVPFAAMLDIEATPVAEPVSASFELVEAQSPTAQCTVQTGSIADAGCVPYYPYCNCAGYVSSEGQCAQTGP